MKILFGVFDWGLGHATRSIPLIEQFLAKGSEVHIISTGKALVLLKGHFYDQCTFYDVPALCALYDNNLLFKANFTFRLPQILRNLRKSTRISKKIISSEGFDKVISDCRYDVFDKPDNSYLINHQLRFISPYGGEYLLERWLSWRMNYYKYVLVPDFPTPSLTGRLSHGLSFFDEKKIHYVGIISRLQKEHRTQDIDYFVSLSGPEPYRSKLQVKIMEQARQLQGRVIVAGGLPSSQLRKATNNVEFYGFLDMHQQQDLMNRAKHVIVRAGYTTLMEVAELGKKALLIPSPGQSEQEYLCKYLQKNRIFPYVKQRKLDLVKDSARIDTYPGFQPPWTTQQSIARTMHLILS